MNLNRSYESSHLKATLRELIVYFGKSKKEAKAIIYDKTNFWRIMRRHPLALHDSPHQWALALLTKVNDIQVLEKYYAKN